MLNRFSIRTKLALVAVLPLIAMSILAGLAWSTLKAVQVGSPAERRVVDSHSVVEDVLPPPLFVVEPFLVVNQAAQQATAAEVRADLLIRYAALKADYQQNHEKWVARSLPANLRRTLLTDSYESAQHFFRLLDDTVIPLIRAGDYAGAEQRLAGDVQPVFAQHRNQILRVIAQSRDYELTERASVAASIRNRSSLFLAGLVLAAGATLLLGMVVARTIRTSIMRLRRAAEEDLPRVMQQLRQADDDELVAARLEPVDLGTRDELADAADAFNAVLSTAVSLAAEQTVQRKHTSEMFVNLGRRNQNLVSRQLKFIDSLERSETDADRLSELFRLDNLATRMRRNAESLLVLAGVEAPRRWRKPVRLYDVVRGAMAEIEEFRRIEIGSFDDVLVQGSSVANITHLLAELMENAARFSPPESVVLIAGANTGSGYVLGVQDRGLGMPPDVLAATNERLRVARRLDEVPNAYLGLFVVARLAQREGISIDLESTDGDGLTAWVRLPAAALAEPAPDDDGAGRTGEATEAATNLRRLELAARADELAERTRPTAAAPAPSDAPPEAPPADAPVAPMGRPPDAPAAVPDAPQLTVRPRRTAAPGGAPSAALPSPPSFTLDQPVIAPVRPTSSALPSPSGSPLPPPGAVNPVVAGVVVAGVVVAGAVVAGDVVSGDVVSGPVGPGPVVVAGDEVASSLGAVGATRSGFKKRTKATEVVSFDRFAASTPPTGTRSAEDMKDRLDRFSAGKRFATSQPAGSDLSEGDDE